MTREKTHLSDSPENEQSDIRELVVHNDDYNTFDYVIKTLIEVCNHKPMQAEQCTLIIHHKGRCPVRSGDQETLEPMYRQILNRGILATIE